MQIQGSTSTMDLNRRQFLKKSSACLLSGLLPPYVAMAHSHSHIHNIIFGFGQTGIGSPLGLGICHYLHQYRYQFKNRPGHHSETAALLVKKSSPNGETILMAKSPTMTLYPYIYKHLNYQVDDFQPLVLLGQYTLILTVGPLVPLTVKTLDEYCDWISDHPQYRGIGFTNLKSPANLAKLMIARNKQYAFNGIAYAGTSMIIDDLVSGNLASALIISGNGHHYFERKILRPIMVTSAHRFPSLPNIPCASEFHLNDMNISGWYGLMLPKKTPGNICNQLLSQILPMTHTDAFHQLQHHLKLTSDIFEPEQFQHHIDKERIYYQTMVERYDMDTAFHA
ncbi:MAG: hypothetical protein CENE_02948 [Candidatus Celerinatantimonas neptuna]|nr:MAG: hypothetical protein CENE_02948 [Candidatus Celerinatantimonas neptuna]